MAVSISELVERGRELLAEPEIGGEVADCCEHASADLAWLRLKQGLLFIFDELEGKSRPADPDAGTF